MEYIICIITAEEEPKRSPPNKLSTGNPESFTTSGSWTQNPAKSTMWLGTEDGWSVYTYKIVHCLFSSRISVLKWKILESV